MATPAPARPAIMTALAHAAISATWQRIDRHARGAAEEPDPEHIHQIRVGLRRLGAALRLFAPHLGARRGRRLARLARRVGRELGATRDLDIAIAQGEARLSRLGARGRPGLSALLEHWRGERDRMRAESVASLAGRRFARLGEELAGLLQRLAGDLPSELAINHVPVALLAAYAPVADLARLDSPDVDSLHALRLRVKRLRYTLEFLSSWAPTGTGPILRRLEDAQDLLGRLSDAALCRELLLAAPAAAGPAPSGSQTFAAAAAFLRERESALDRLARQGRRVAARLNSPAFRRALWRLARRAAIPS